MKRFNTKKIKERAKKIIRILAEKSFITSLFLILLALILGGLLFYQYNIQLDKVAIKPGEVTLKIKEQAYQDILDEWANMEENFRGANLRNYVNPFVVQ